MTKKREKPALMPQSNYSTEIQNKKNMVKLHMHSVSRFLHIPNLISRLTFPLIAHVFIPLFLFLLSFSDLTAYFGLYVKAPKEKEVMWPTKGEMASVMLESSVTLNDSFHLTQRWPTQFPTGLVTPADILYVQQLVWLILHSVQVPRLSAPNQWLIQEHIQSACHISRMEKNEEKIGVSLMLCYFFFFVSSKLLNISLVFVRAQQTHITSKCRFYQQALL